MENMTPWKLIRSYKWKSVFVRYLKYCLLLVLIVFIPYNVIIFYYFNYTYETEISQLSTTNAMKSSGLLDLLFVDFDRYADEVYANSDMMRFLTMAPEQFPSESELFSRISRSLYLTKRKSNLIREIYYYSFGNDQAITSEGVSQTNAAEYEWMRIYQATKSDRFLVARRIESDTYNTLYFCKKIPIDTNIAGLYCVEMDYGLFSQKVRQLFPENPERLCIVNDIGLILYSNVPEWINTPVMQWKDDLAPIYKQARHSQVTTRIQGGSVITAAVSDQFHLVTISYISKDRMGGDNGKIRTMILFGAFATLFMALLIALFISFKMYKYIANVIILMNNSSDSASPDSSLGELFTIGSGITSKNTRIEKELKQKIDALKKAQSAALQAQINPHFLFNTLQLINLSVMKEVRYDNDAVHIIESLSDLLRVSYSSQNYIVTVREELDNLQKYLDIQKLRYQERLTVDVFLSADCADMKTIKLILQPLVENSVIHGLSSKNADWQITVRAYRQENCVVFEIADNGAGIPPKRLEEIQKRLRNNTGRQDIHIGLRNVNSRLRLVFGNNYSFEIQSAPGQGTRLKITHPQLDADTEKMFS